MLLPIATAASLRLSLTVLVLQLVGLLPALPVIACALHSCTLDWPCRAAGYGGVLLRDVLQGNAVRWGCDAALIEELFSSVTSGMLTAVQPLPI